MNLAMVVWLVLFVAFLGLEAMTAGLTSVWFAGGALAAALAALSGGNIVLQLVLFIGVSLVLLVFTRPLAMRSMKNSKEETNVNSLIGRTAVVTQCIDNRAQTGQVRINDVEWLARTEQDGQIIPERMVVEILRVQGVTLIVKEVKEETR